MSITTPGPATSAPGDTRPLTWDRLPPIDLRQLLRMSDDTGLFQHALFGVPDPRHGYCIDDNDRALIAGLLHSQLRGYDERVVPVNRYLTFIAYAYNEQERRFRNFMGYDRRWLEETGSHDSRGRTIWALGVAVRLAPSESLGELAWNLFHKALDAMDDLAHLRSWAFSLLGLEAVLAVRPDDARARSLRDEYARRLFEKYREHATPDWPWWEDIVTYDNGKLPHALIVSGRAMGEEAMVEAGLASLRWLIGTQFERHAEGGGDGESYLSIIGNEGWLRRGQPRPDFDQQPLEAHALVEACLVAADGTGDAEVEVEGEARRWSGWALWCFEWFVGRNKLREALYHHETGGCQDGLRADGPNKNQGAESILAYLLSVLELHRWRDLHPAATSVRGGGEGGEGGDDTPVTVAWVGVGAMPANLSGGEGVELITLAGAGQADDRPLAEALRVLAAGLHLLLHPEALAGESGIAAQRLIEAAAQRDVRVAVALTAAYAPAVRTLAERIASGTGGRPLRVHVVWRVPGAATSDGEAYLPRVIEGIDLVRRLLGDFRIVWAARTPAGEDSISTHIQCITDGGDGAGLHLVTRLDQGDGGGGGESVAIHVATPREDVTLRGEREGNPTTLGRWVWNNAADPASDAEVNITAAALDNLAAAVRDSRQRVAGSLEDVRAALELSRDVARHLSRSQA